MHKVVGIIPARLKSTRFPGKVLANLAGKSLIQRTYDQVTQSRLLDEVVIATDDKTIFDHVNSFGAKAFMTDAAHINGTDRIAEVVEKNYMDATIIVNVQADEPLLDPSVVDTLIDKLLTTPDAVCATPLIQITNHEDVFKPSIVKCVMDEQGRALYFSRAPIPFPQNPKKMHAFYRHLGVYCFRRDFLLTYKNLTPSRLQQIEDLEQLKILEHGYPIHACVVEDLGIGVDTPEDLKRAEELCLENTSL